MEGNIPVYIEKEFSGEICIYKLEAVKHKTCFKRGGSQDQLLSDALDMLFIQDQNGRVTYSEIKQAIMCIRKVGTSFEGYPVLKSAGLLDLNYKQLTYSPLYRRFLELLKAKFSVERGTFRVKGKPTAGFTGIKLANITNI